ncbi:hypothetical protein MMC07_002297 [Pseudocyphellaria aurata]|nr:hypothetical protein [Pseudocyphellaria aurata]
MSLPTPGPGLFEPPQRLLTPPGSPPTAPAGPAIKRRRHLRESDDISGEMPLETFLYRTDPYRSSSAKPLFPYPLRLRLVNPILQDRLRADSEIDPNIRRILRTYGIEERYFEFCKQSKPDYPGGVVLINTLRVLVDVDDHVSTINWSKARRALSKMLYDRGFDSIVVEILDPARTTALRLFPISPDHPVISVYESFRGRLIEQVTRSLGKSWTTLCLFSVHRPAQEPGFAVVISIQPRTACDWPVLRSKLENIIRLEFEAKKIAQPPTSIDIEFAPGNWSMLEPDQKKPGISFVDYLSQHPKLGTSIGVKGEQGGGSLGGFFKLKCGSHWDHGFLTNYHVVKPPDSSPQSVKEAADLYGTQYRQGLENDPTKTSVDFFAVKDVEASRDKCDSIISDCREELDTYATAALRREEVGLEPRPGLEHQIVTVKEKEKRAKLHEEKLLRLPIKLGNVLVSSGRAWSVHKRILDWAFVAMDDNSVNRDIWKSLVKNQRPHQGARGMYKHLPEDYDIRGRNYDVGDPPADIAGFSSLQMGEWYFKVGRTTGITTGICHGTKIILNMSGTKDVTGVRTRYDKSGKFLGPDESVNFIEEYQIINAMKGTHSAEDFCQTGDSGALIINNLGEVAGLLFANYTSQMGPLNQRRGWYHGAGIATTMPDVLESIAMRTTPRDSAGNQIGPPGQLLLP